MALSITEVPLSEAYQYNIAFRDEDDAAPFQEWCSFYGVPTHVLSFNEGKTIAVGQVDFRAMTLLKLSWYRHTFQ